MRAGSVGRCLVMPRSTSVDPTSLQGERAWVFLSSRNRSMSQGAQKGLQARRYCAAGGQRLVYRQGAYICTTNHVVLACIEFHIAGLYLRSFLHWNTGTGQESMYIQRLRGKWSRNCVACADLLPATRSELLYPRTYEQL